jgi:hypothetical protein
MRPAGLLPPERAELAARTPIANVGDTRGVDGALCPVVVGRGAELATLVDHLDAAAGGAGRGCAISAPTPA